MVVEVVVVFVLEQADKSTATNRLRASLVFILSIPFRGDIQTHLDVVRITTFRRWAARTVSYLLGYCGGEGLELAGSHP
jgi:hypothetical protein